MRFFRALLLSRRGLWGEQVIKQELWTLFRRFSIDVRGAEDAQIVFMWRSQLCGVGPAVRANGALGTPHNIG
jgi:hypothetical protein